MPLKSDLNKILIIGAGPNIVGTIAEFDLITKQAIESLLEENIKLVIVNPNPATVATDPDEDVTVYLEPMTLPFIKRILRMEEPDAIITAFGSNVAINMADQLRKDGILRELDIELLTISDQLLDSIGDKRQLIDTLQANNIPSSKTFDLSESVTELQKHLENIEFPLVLLKKNKYTLNEHLTIKDENELFEFLQAESSKVDYDPDNYQIYEDLSEWEEILVEVIRDNNGNLNFINFAGSIEPVKVNSGDSILVSPAMTLTNAHVQVIRHLTKKVGQIFDLKGIMSIHFAVKHQGDHTEIKILSLKPRITRSALLAYRAGIYNIGYVVAKIALGYDLNEITDPNSGLNAAVEPVLDTVAVKVPNWSFTENGDNFYLLNDQMKASGEAIGMGRNFETALFKGLESISSNIKNNDIYTDFLDQDQDKLIEQLKHTTDGTILQLIAALTNGLPIAKVRQIFSIHPVYLQKFQHIADLIKELKEVGTELIQKPDLLMRLKKFGFSDLFISKLSEIEIEKIRELRKEFKITPSYIGIDGSAGMYEPNVSAVYSSYGVKDEIQSLSNTNKKVLIIGTEPFKISLNSEFDYMLYHAIITLNSLGYQTVIISNNSEAISSSYRLVNRVYFEPITIENILEIAKKENIETILTQFSGKNISSMNDQLVAHGLKILGHNQSNLKIEQKNVLNNLLKELGYNGISAFSTDKVDEAVAFAQKTEYPVLIGGHNKSQSKKSAVVFDEPALKQYIETNELSNINISKFIDGQKYEVAAISDGESVTIPGIIEHLEQSGSHASDSIAVFSPQNLTIEQRRQIKDMAIAITKKTKLRGLLNLHFLIYKGTIYVLQVKTYAGHNVAFLSKSIGKNITDITTKVLSGMTLSEMNYSEDIWPSSKLIHVKMPVSSYIGYEGRNLFDSRMKSSGSVMGRDTRLSKALYKGYEGAGLEIPTYGTVFISVKNSDKQAAVTLAQRLHRLGFKIVATEGTAEILAEEGITINIVPKIYNGHLNIIDKIKAHKVNLVINVTDYSDVASQDATEIRDAALATHIPVFSSLKTSKYIIEVLESLALTTQPI